MASLLVPGLALLLTLATCAGDEADLHGIWELESFTVGGVGNQVDIGVNAAHQPWVEFGGEQFQVVGNAGCNEWGADEYTYARGLLTLGGHTDSTAGVCPGLMAAEEAFSDRGGWKPGSSIIVEIDGERMRWWIDDLRLDFTLVDERPERTPGY